MSYKRLTYCDVHEDVIVSYQYEYGTSPSCPLCDSLKKIDELEETVEELEDSLADDRQEVQYGGNN